MATQIKVLCVDDDQYAADSTGQLLEKAGCEVRVCHGGGTALAVAEGFRPDVCVLDMQMPGMDGPELAVRLREQAGGRPLRCIAVTGLWDIAAQHRSHNAGFEEHLVKPVDPQHLVRVVLGELSVDPV